MKKYILNRATSKEFFVQKAAGWALREYAKYEATVVLDFVRANQNHLAPLTIREATKHFKDWN